MATAANEFVWRTKEVHYDGEQSQLYLFDRAYVGWVSEGFEGGYDAHFIVGQVWGSANGVVLGNFPTREAAKSATEQCVRQVFQMDAVSA